MDYSSILKRMYAEDLCSLFIEPSYWYSFVCICRNAKYQLEFRMKYCIAILNYQVLIFSRRYCWGFRPIGIWHRVFGWVVLGYYFMLCEWFWYMTSCVWASRSGIWHHVFGLVVLGYYFMLLCEWLWYMTSCGWVSGSGIWRHVFWWVVLGYDITCLAEWFLDMTPCIWVNGSGIWHRVFR
jgi:hypothetical protein